MANKEKHVLDPSENDSVIGNDVLGRKVDRFKSGCKNRLQL
jgi:hypothetical protein